jgi:hypothetical protein
LSTGYISDSDIDFRSPVSSYLDKGGCLITICDDGTVWKLDASRPRHEAHWSQLPSIPGSLHMLNKKHKRCIPKVGGNSLF